MATDDRPTWKAPHGGTLLPISEGFLEVSVFETGVPPRFRLYFFHGDKRPSETPNDPVTIQTVRPGGKAQTFTFAARGGYLESVDDIPEPHEFDVVVKLGTSTHTTRFTEDAHGHDHGPTAAQADHAHGHGHSHDGHGHGHTHGIVDPMIVTTGRGLWAVKWSFVGLFVTACLQLVVVILSSSVGLLADMIHNFGDAATALPLGIAFMFARRRPTRRFTFGYGRVEDLAGLAVVLTIVTSAVVAGYESVQRLIHPHAVSHLGAIIAASIIGFVGNEAVAVFRIRVGKAIGSAALIADGYHARTDGWTSLAVLVGAVGVYLGYPLADPIIGIVITLAILGVVWQSVKAIFSRILDGVEPEILDQISSTARQTDGVVAVNDVHARWIGHRLHAEVSVAVAAELTVAAGHEIAKRIEHDLRHHLKFLGSATIHVDPADQPGEAHHRGQPHSHDGLPLHAH